VRSQRQRHREHTNDHGCQGAEQSIENPRPPAHLRGPQGQRRDQGTGSGNRRRSHDATRPGRRHASLDLDSACLAGDFRGLAVGHAACGPWLWRGQRRFHNRRRLRLESNRRRRTDWWCRRILRCRRCIRGWQLRRRPVGLRCGHHDCGCLGLCQRVERRRVFGRRFCLGRLDCWLRRCRERFRCQWRRRFVSSRRGLRRDQQGRIGQHGLWWDRQRRLGPLVGLGHCRRLFWRDPWRPRLFRLKESKLIETCGERCELLGRELQPGREPHPGNDLGQRPAIERKSDRVLVVEETEARPPFGIVNVDALDAIFSQDGRNQIAPQARPVKHHACIFTRGSSRRQLS
jgi:hypothetical protein